MCRLICPYFAQSNHTSPQIRYLKMGQLTRFQIGLGYMMHRDLMRIYHEEVKALEDQE